VAAAVVVVLAAFAARFKFFACRSAKRACTSVLLRLYFELVVAPGESPGNSEAKSRVGTRACVGPTVAAQCKWRDEHGSLLRHPIASERKRGACKAMSLGLKARASCEAVSATIIESS
jgi:hypothetical protein